MRYSPPPKDLTGQVFGRLTALEHVKQVGNMRTSGWICRCSCGTLTTVTTVNLKTGNSKSCGCLNAEKQDSRKLKLEGQRFGRLVVLEKSDKKGSRGETYWKVRCDCGVEKTVSSKLLRCGDAVSCGCYHRERVTKHGLSKTKPYRHKYKLRRRELSSKLDCEWTYNMSKTILEIFPRCVVCGLTEIEHKTLYGHSLHVDHVLPLSEGNGLKPGNAVVLCSKCNHYKKSKNIFSMPDFFKDRVISYAELFKKVWENTHETG